MTERSIPAPVPTLEPVAVLEALNASAGTRLELIGAAPGGEVGAAFVRWPDGRAGVLTRGDNLIAEERTAGILRLARSRGIPCPGYDLIHPLDDQTVIVQERLPGTLPRRVDDGLIGAMVIMSDRFRDLLADRLELPALPLYLDRSGPGFCLHESLARYDARTRRLLDRVREVGEQPSAVMAGNDLVHADFHPGNVLVDETGGLTGVVDWSDVGRGDRRFCLVTLAFDLGWGRKFNGRYRTLSAKGQQQVVDRLDAMDPDALRAYWAHMTLRLVDWSIRHHTPEVVDHYIGFALSRPNLWT